MNRKKKYAGNAILNFRSLTLIGFVIVYISYKVIAISSRNNLNVSAEMIPVFVLIFYFFGANQMNYFIIEDGNLIIKNHYLSWQTTTIEFSNIVKFGIETPWKEPKSLRIFTKDLNSKLYRAGSLRQNDWDNLVSDLQSVGIPLQSP